MKILLSGLVLCLLVLAPLPAASVDAPGWSDAFAPPGFDALTTCALDTPEGLVVGGDFRLMGDVPCAHIALYDGESWRQLGDGFDHVVKALILHEGDLIAVGGFTASGGTPLSHVARWDGAAWRPMGDGLPTGDGGLIVYDGDLWSAGWRWDGTAWTQVLVGDQLVFPSLVFEGRLLLSGLFSEVNGVPATGLAAWDGVSVSVPYPGNEPIRDLQDHDGVLYMTSIYSGRFTRWTGEDWVDVEGLDPWVTALGVWDGRLYAVKLMTGYNVGLVGSVLFAWDGAGWTHVLRTVPRDIRFIAPLTDGIAIGGEFARVDDLSAHAFAAIRQGVVRSYDGPGLGADGLVYDFSARDDSLLVGGAFHVAAGLASKSVVLHDGEGWLDRGCPHVVGVVGWWDDGPLAMAYQFSDYVHLHFLFWVYANWSEPWLVWPYDEYLAFGRQAETVHAVSPTRVYALDLPFHVHPGAEITGGFASGGGELGDRLLVHGEFTAVDGVPAVGVATFDGTAWSACGEGVRGDVEAYADLGGDLVVAGRIALGDDEPEHRAARFDGAAWSLLPGVFEDEVRALAVHDGSLYAGGLFVTVDGVTVNGVARWTGTGWAPLGEGLGLSGGVTGAYALASHDDRLWVGGSFDTAGGRPALNLCTWTEPIVPVLLRDFRADREGGAVRLRWETSGPAGDLVLTRTAGGRRLEIARVADAPPVGTLLDADAPRTACRYEIARLGAGGTLLLDAVELAAAVPAAPRLDEPAPNPFNPATRIAFALTRPGPARLSVHDLQGRRVAVLVDERLPAGEHAARWDGRDDAGRAMPSGTYLVRLRLDGETRSVKAVLIR